MLSALLWLLAGLVLILITVLCTPLRLHIWFSSGAEPSMRLKLGLLGGLVPIPVLSVNGRREPKKERPKTEPVKKEKKRRGGSIDIRRFISAAPRLISGLIHTMKIEKFRATIGFGFDDPANTGMVYGMLTPIERIFSGQKASIVLHPDFDRAKLDGDGEFTARFTPVTILPPIFGFGWNVFLQPKLPKVFQ